MLNDTNSEKRGKAGNKNNKTKYGNQMGSQRLCLPAMMVQPKDRKSYTQILGLVGLGDNKNPTFSVPMQLCQLVHLGSTWAEKKNIFNSHTKAYSTTKNYCI